METHESGWSISDGKPRSRSQLECSQAEEIVLLRTVRPSAIDQGPPPLGRKSALHNLLILNINFMKNTLTEIPISMFNQISEHLWLSQVDTKLTIIPGQYMLTVLALELLYPHLCVSICVCIVCKKCILTSF